MGNRYTWTTTSSSITKEVFAGRHKLLHQVDRGRPLAKITKRNTKNFIWKNVICHFGIPRVIFFDNTKQFDTDGFKLFCSDLSIFHHFSSLGHPQANGHVKVTLRNLKMRLEKSKGGWTNDLPNVLWAYHTTSRIPMG